jgi:hypothetical protein
LTIELIEDTLTENGLEINTNNNVIRNFYQSWV